MANMRSITTRATLLAGRLNPSFGYIAHYDDRKSTFLDDYSPRQNSNSFLHRRLFGSNTSSSPELNSFFQDQRFARSLTMGSSFCRHMSTTMGEESDKMNIMSDVAEVLTDTTVETVASQAVVNEVAIAAADSYFPVAALQYLIDGVHSFTGLNWWASIVLTTFMIRGATIPFLINQLKATSKLTLMRPRLEEIKQDMQSKGMNPKDVAEGKARMNRLFKEYGVTPFTPLQGLLFQGPVFVSFFFAIRNMAEKCPSFTSGGAYWFTDLTTPDSLYIFPILASVTFLITVECNMQEGMEGNPVTGTMKKFLRGLAVLTVPLTMSFPKAIFCYWVTSNLFSIMYGLVIKQPGVKKLFGVPEIPKAPPPSATAPQGQQSVFSLFPALSKRPAAAGREEPPPSAPKPATDQKLSSASALSQRLRNLERQVKGRKKRGKR